MRRPVAPFVVILVEFHVIYITPGRYQFLLNFVNRLTARSSAHGLTRMMTTAHRLIVLVKGPAALNAGLLVGCFPLSVVGLLHVLLGERKLREHLPYHPLVDIVRAKRAQDTADGRRRGSGNCREDIFITKGGHGESDQNAPDEPKVWTLTVV